MYPEKNKVSEKVYSILVNRKFAVVDKHIQRTIDNLTNDGKLAGQIDPLMVGLYRDVIYTATEGIPQASPFVEFHLMGFTVTDDFAEWNPEAAEIIARQLQHEISRRFKDYRFWFSYFYPNPQDKWNADSVVYYIAPYAPPRHEPVRSPAHA